MTASKIHIDIFTDYVCPWCYLSSAAVEKLCQNYPVDIRWVPFPLHPSTPPAGLSLDELFQGRNMDAMHEQLHKRMDAAGLEYCDRSMTYNSRLAQELAQWADTLKDDAARGIHKALYRAYFVHNQNLADKDVLLGIVSKLGLDVDTARKVLDEGSYSDTVDEAWSRARQQQVTGVPCFVANNYMMAGSQPYEELERFVQFLTEQTETTKTEN